MAKRKNLTIERSKLDIIIPVHGRLDLLKQCIDSVQKTCEDLTYKIIIVDDFSPQVKDYKSYYQTLIQEYNNISVYYNDKNYGFPYTVNYGISKGNSELVLILNSDVILEENCVQTLIKTIENNEVDDSPFSGKDNKGIGIVSPLLTFPDDSKTLNKPAGKVQHAGISFGMNRMPKHRLIGWSIDNPKVHLKRELQAVSGACILTKRSIINTIIGLNKQLGDNSGIFNLTYGRGTFEDMEFCLATRSLGYKVVYEPKAKGIHYTNSSSETTGGFPISRNFMIFKARCGHLIGYDDWLVW